MTAYDFPFGILEVAQTLRLIRRFPGPNSIYFDCPFCGKRGKLNLNYIKNVWRCNYCGEAGGMLELYAKVYDISTSDALYELKEILGDTRKNGRLPIHKAGDIAVMGTKHIKEIPQSSRAEAKCIHRTYTCLLQMLSLNPAHFAHLKSPKRGLNDGQIVRLNLKSTPPPFLCRSITRQLQERGCAVQGVPGFYLDKSGEWTIHFSRYTSGILIPALSLDGLICGMQILLDVPFKDREETSEHKGAKYIWLSSASKPMGVTSGSPVHCIGAPGRTMYITEGLLKGDIAHMLSSRSFLAVAGANNLGGIEQLLPVLAAIGTTQIIEAFDMDKYTNPAVQKGADKLRSLVERSGMNFRRLRWKPMYKGVDDWLLSLKESRRTENKAA